MADIEKLLEAVEGLDLRLLSADDLAGINEVMRPVQEESAQLSEDEVFNAIDEAVDEVRRERKASTTN